MIIPEIKLYYILYWIGERNNSGCYIHSESFIPKTYSDRTSAYDEAVDLESKNKIPGTWEIVKTERRDIIKGDWID